MSVGDPNGRSASLQVSATDARAGLNVAQEVLITSDSARMRRIERPVTSRTVHDVPSMTWMTASRAICSTCATSSAVSSTAPSRKTQSN